MKDNKVLNFLEWVLMRKNQHARDNSKKAVNDALCDIYGTQRFYSQPFKPEMITELFEGWLDKMREDEELVCYKVNAELYSDPEIIFPSKGIEVMIVRQGNSYSYFKYPKTVDSFKTLLEEQAGIELEWKPEIVNKYFK